MHRLSQESSSSSNQSASAFRIASLTGANQKRRFFTWPREVRISICFSNTAGPEVLSGTAAPVSSEEEARELIEEMRRTYHDATHHVYAYLLDGERIARGVGGHKKLRQEQYSELT